MPGVQADFSPSVRDRELRRHRARMRADANDQFVLAVPADGPRHVVDAGGEATEVLSDYLPIEPHLGAELRLGDREDRHLPARRRMEGRSGTRSSCDSGAPRREPAGSRTRARVCASTTTLMKSRLSYRSTSTNRGSARFARPGTGPRCPNDSGTSSAEMLSATCHSPSRERVTRPAAAAGHSGTGSSSRVSRQKQGRTPRVRLLPVMMGRLPLPQQLQAQLDLAGEIGLPQPSTRTEDDACHQFRRSAN